MYRLNAVYENRFYVHVKFFLAVIVQMIIYSYKNNRPEVKF